MLVITKYMQPPWNYGEVTLPRNLILALALLGQNVKVFSIYRRSTHEQHNNISIFPDNVSLSYFKNDAAILKCVLQNRRAKLIHVMSFSFTKASMLRLVMQSTMFFYIYSPIPDILGGSVKAEAYLKTVFGYNIARLNGKLITTSPYTYDRVIGKMVIPSDRVYLIPAPVYLTEMYPNEGRKDSSYDLKVLYIGHLFTSRFPYKQIMNAITELKRSGLSIIFKIVTPALKCNQKNFLILRNIFKRNNLNVYIECRNLDEREKFLEFTSSDVYLYPSLGTAAIDPPLTVLEAMLSGCLVVATNVQSIPWILSGDRGIIIDSSNLSKEITNSLIIALDKKRRNKIINNAKAYIRSVHSIESVSRKLDAIINESM